MAKSRIKWVREDGYAFAFVYDKDEPSLLHIYVRHLASIDDALDCFFDSHAKSTWNAQHERFECQNATHGLFWVWLDEAARKVLIITCFKA